MSICTYDNPATMARECWRDGRLLYSYSFTLLYADPFPMLPDRFFFGANVGLWETGRLVGDRAALKGIDVQQRTGDQ